MRYTRALRYLAPNLLTTANIMFGMMSLLASFEERYVDAAWLIVYAVLTDRLDGVVARLVRGSSELGVQLDSFADLLNFGIAPAVLVYTSLGSRPDLPFTEGGGRYFLLAGCAAWVLAAIFRLARYNITTGEPEYPKIFFGVPTTLVGGLLVAWYLTLLKYVPPGEPMAVDAFGGAYLFGDFATPHAVWRYFPVFMFVGAFLMASTLRMPKLGLATSKTANAFIFSNVALGYIFGFARLFPEYIICPPSMWLVCFLTWGALSPGARRMKPPPLFPEVDPPPGKEPIRPEDDLMPEGEDLELDELADATTPE
jgi:CDP-diacylglycerol--serine O-phosphatidyltransferase